MNAINLIIPYRYEGMWVFDDPRVGLDKSRSFQARIQ